jgi:copper transport protein
MTRAAAAAALVVLVWMVVGAAPASAHATLQSAMPAAGQQFPAGHSPPSVALVFDQGVAVAPDSVRVLDSSGDTVRTGDAQHDGADSRVTAALPALADGTYVVSWRVVSTDSHPIQGAFTFGVGRAAGSVDTADLLSGAAGSRTVGQLFGLDRALGYLCALVLLGGLAFVGWAWRRGAERRDVMTLLYLAALGLFVTSVAAIGLQGAYASGRGLAAVVRPSSIDAVLHARFGHAAAVRALLALVLLSIARTLPRRSRDGGGHMVDVLFVVTALATAVSFAYAGHGDTGRYVRLGFTTDLVHILAAAVWLGGVAVLAVALRDPERAGDAEDGAAVFARIALPAIVVVSASGTVQAWRQVETWGALVHTSYGRLLLLKVLVVGAIVVVASASRDLLRRRVVPGVRATVSAMSPRGATATVATEVRELRDAVWVEVALACVVLALTAGLVNSEPAREAVAGVPHTYEAILRTPEMVFRVGVQPALPGLDTIVVTPQTPAGAAAAPAQLTGTLALPGKVAPIPLQFVSVAGGPYVTSVDVPLAGTWTLDLRALRTKFDESAAETTIRFG